MRISFDFHEKSDDIRNTISQYFLKQFNNDAEFCVSISVPPHMRLRQKGGIIIFENRQSKWDKFFSYVAFDQFIREKDPSVTNQIHTTLFIELIRNPDDFIEDLKGDFQYKRKDNFVFIKNQFHRQKFSFAMKYCGANQINVRIDTHENNEILQPCPITKCFKDCLPPICSVVRKLDVKNAEIDIKDLRTLGLSCLQRSYLYVVCPQKPISWYTFCKYVHQAIEKGLKIWFAGFSIKKYRVPHVTIHAYAKQLLHTESRFMDYTFGTNVRILDDRLSEETKEKLIYIANKFCFTIDFAMTKMC